MNNSKEMMEQRSLDLIRHSAAHVMAEAVLLLFPETKFGIGPAIEDGFYYDFELPRPLTPDDLPIIEAKMLEIIAKKSPFGSWEASKEEARQIFVNQPYKLELINEIPDEKVNLYRQGIFTDLCRGPHVADTSKITAIKLMSIAGAYWRGDERRPMLQRIYGVAFHNTHDLKEYLKQREEASLRDHRKLGKDLSLFSLHEEAGPGLVFWHPKGSTIRRLVEDFWKEEHWKRGYELLYTPHIARLDLWKKSGHWEFYHDYLYSPMEIEGQQYILKPMNCLGHILIYQTKLHSYRELPLRYAELGTVYRYERSGVLHGLSRVRGFTQDDAHIFCRPDQLENEVVAVLDLARFMIDTFQFTNYRIMLSTRPEKYTGTLAIWEMATETLRQALVRHGIDYQVDPGEGVFYGPKIDIKFEDALGRGWQGPTIQIDFNLPKRFDVHYIGDDGKEHQVVMVHRTVLGSMERFLACLTEHYGGAFPLWLAPVQVILIPVTDRHFDYVQKVYTKLRGYGIRVILDDRSERMNLKIREAQLNKIPYMVVIGDKEIASQTLSIRLRTGEQLSQCTINDFRKIINRISNGKLAKLL